MTKPSTYTIELSPGQDPQEAVGEIFQNLKKYPEGVEVKMPDGSISTFQSKTMVADLLRFFQNTATVEPEATVAEPPANAKPAPDKKATRKRGSTKRRKK